MVGIVGKSGTGKSSSLLPNQDIPIKGLNPKETVIINCFGQSLPGPSWKKLYNAEKKNYVVTSSPTEIVKVMDMINIKRPEIKNIVIDDYQYTMAQEFFSRAQEKSYDKFTDIGQGAYQILTKYRELREDLTIFVLTHSDENQEIKTIGKMVNEKLTPAGLFTVVLYTDVKIKGKVPEYRFVTNNDGTYPAKSPYGMFPDLYISNDLSQIVTQIKNYEN